MSEFDKQERPAWAIRRGTDTEQNTTQDRPERNERPERPSYADRGERPARPGRGERGDRPERAYSDRGDRTSRSYGDRPNRSDSSDRSYGDKSNRSESSDRSYGDKSNRSESSDRSYGDKSNRSESSDRSYGDRPDRAFEKGRDRDQKPDIITELTSIDKDILRLITKRTRILSRIGTTHVSDKERKLRTSWEEQAAKTSRDPRLIRQLFALLQELDVNLQDDNRPSGFVLAPKRLPVNITMPAPSCGHTTQIYLAFMGATGAHTLITGVNLNDSVIECLKAFNQLGAVLRWEDDGTIKGQETTQAVSGLAAQRNAPMLDKVIHLGDDIFTLYLVLFHALTRPARLKLIGESSLALANLSPLRNLLASLGARLTSLVPGQDGLPARIEASALLPETVCIPKDLPDLAFKALCTALPFWDKAVSVDMKDYPQGAEILTQIEPFFKAWNVQYTCTLDEHSFTVTPSELSAPETLTPPVDMRLATYLLALPAFTDGRITLQGLQNAETKHMQASKALLEQVGLHIHQQDDQITSAWNGKRNNSEHPVMTPLKDISALPVELVPLGLVFALAPNLQERRGPLPILPSGDVTIDPVLLDSFITILGFEQADGKLVPYQGTTTAWASPDVTWTLALALAALLRSGMRLSNPATASKHIPAFWQFYNALPKHASDISTPPEGDEENNEISATGRRRVLIGHTPEAEMPDEVCTYQKID